MVATIQFKAKLKTMYSVENNPLYQFVEVPVFSKSHCNMAQFRMHKKYSGLANSDLFNNILSNIRKTIVGDYNNRLRIDQLPDNVTVDTSKFLAVVTIILD